MFIGEVDGVRHQQAADPETSESGSCGDVEDVEFVGNVPCCDEANCRVGWVGYGGPNVGERTSAFGFDVGAFALFEALGVELLNQRNSGVICGEFVD